MIRFCSLQSKENAVLQASLERRKRDLHERRQALEQDVRKNIFSFMSFNNSFFHLVEYDRMPI